MMSRCVFEYEGSGDLKKRISTASRSYGDLAIDETFELANPAAIFP